MRKLVALMILACFVVMLGGCATLSETSQERSARIKRQRAKEWKLVVEDWDRFMLQDRPSRLSRRGI